MGDGAGHRWADAGYSGRRPGSRLLDRMGAERRRALVVFVLNERAVHPGGKFLLGLKREGIHAEDESPQADV
jgi:hypothetical protein